MGGSDICIGLQSGLQDRKLENNREIMLFLFRDNSEQRSYTATCGRARAAKYEKRKGTLLYVVNKVHSCIAVVAVVP